MIALTDASGAIVCSYGYDSWGVPVTRTGPMRIPGTVGFIQPFRYRGYVWDEETGLYYLRSRHYRPSWGRFVSADSYLTNHIYAYCKNNPVSHSDPDGTKTGTIWKRFREFFLGDGFSSHMHKRPDYVEAGYGRQSNPNPDTQQPVSDGYVTYIVPSTGDSVSVPDHVFDRVTTLVEHDGEAMLHYHGGGQYHNNPSNPNAQTLPSEYAPFYEYDVNMTTVSIEDGRRTRDLERLVFGTGGDGGIWYTQDHYYTFLRIY